RFFSSREVRNTGFGRPSATTDRLIWPGNLAAGVFTAAFRLPTTRGRVWPLETAAAGGGTLTVMGAAEFSGNTGTDGPPAAERSPTGMFFGNASSALRWAASASAASLFWRKRARCLRHQARE